jgi:hypothetical protein
MESQYTNNGSTEVLPDSELAFQFPFDYSWVRFDDGELRGIQRSASLIETQAWLALPTISIIVSIY